MKDISDIISILWGTFLMRDIVAKITPGAVLVAAMAVTLAKAANVSVFDKIALIGAKIKDIPTFFCVLAGVGIVVSFYVVGLAVQTAAFEICHFLFKYSEWDNIISDGRKRYADGEIKQKLLNEKNWRALKRERAALGDDLFRKYTLDRFTEKCVEYPRKGYERERRVVFKEMCANMSMALALGLVVLLVGEFVWVIKNDNVAIPEPWKITGSIFILLLAVILWVAHRIYRRRQTLFEIQSLNLVEKDSELIQALRSHFEEWAKLPKVI